MLIVRVMLDTLINFTGSLVFKYESVISRTYRFPQRDSGSLEVEEILIESRLSFLIPILYL